jgi:phospholipase/carboxylesterase
MALIRTVEDPKLVLHLLHGYGSDHRDMFGLAQELHPSVEVRCHPAPIEMLPGRAWFPLEWTANGIVIEPSDYWTAVDKLLPELEIIESKTVVGGFSQGAMIALGATQRLPQTFVGTLLMSGRGNRESCDAIAGKVFHGHGLYDEVIEIRHARELNQQLISLGDRYEYHEYPMPHSICEPELDHINAWLDRLIGEHQTPA